MKDLREQALIDEQRLELGWDYCQVSQRAGYQEWKYVCSNTTEFDFCDLYENNFTVLGQPIL
jgi:hypothetical protein